MKNVHTGDHKISQRVQKVAQLTKIPNNEEEKREEKFKEEEKDMEQGQTDKRIF